ncbi:MAG: diaminopimelate epimerase [Acidobacteria bacterium]|nr:diaminopimelate epimerase [Acidobacteriota bacterium]
MIKFSKAHAYGNDFLYIAAGAAADVDHAALARELCDRHTGIGADGLILFTPTPDGASMVLFNADGGRAEVSGNGVRGLAALLLRDDRRADAGITIHTEGGVKHLTRVERAGTRQTFRAAMGLPENLRQSPLTVAGEALQVVTMTFGNPQSVVLGPLPDEARFQRLGPALERHAAFRDGTNVEFALVESPSSIRIRIWERGVGPTRSSGTGSCAALIAAAAFGGASRDAEVVAPGGAQRVVWRDDAVYLTGWAEVVFDGEWVGR